MKNIVKFLTLFMLFASVSCFNRSNEGEASIQADGMTGTAEIKFARMEHDFGSILAGEKVGTIFTFTNGGSGELVITSASTSCGCTVPKYDKEPIAPGESGSIEVVFDSTGRSGKQTKTITVMSNSSVPVIVLRITADIVTK